MRLLRPTTQCPVNRTGKLVALVCALLALSCTFAQSSSGQSSSASLHIRAARPALLWLEAENAAADNVSDPASNNLPLTVEVTSDGSLSVAIRSNYDYWLTVAAGSGVSHISGGSTGLEWVTLPEELLPETAEGEVVTLKLEWQEDCTLAAQTACAATLGSRATQALAKPEKRPDGPVP